MPSSNYQPQVTSGQLTVTRITSDSISIKWEKATADNPDPVVYKVGLTEEENLYDPWHIVNEGKEMYAFTFTGLKPQTSYGFFVKAFVGGDLICQYPLFNGCMTAKTEEPDKEAPTVRNKAINVVKVTRDSISISWEAATDNVTEKKLITYRIWFTLSETPSDSWHPVYEGKGITNYTFKNLKEGTGYSFYIMAYDEAGNYLQYPLNNGCMTARTAALDKQAPTVSSRALTATNVMHDRFTLSWKAATDNETPASQIRYQVFLYENGRWLQKQDARGITSYTLTGLNPDTVYYVIVKATDAVGNVLNYPNDTASKGVRTKAAPVNKLELSVIQGAAVLRGTDTVCLELIYNYVRYDSNFNIIEQKVGSWKRKWSDTQAVNAVIALPAGYYFENNKVHVITSSRRAASAGLNKWKTCNQGDVDISSGKLTLKLSGSYYSYNVQYTKM